MVLSNPFLLFDGSWKFRPIFVYQQIITGQLKSNICLSNMDKFIQKKFKFIKIFYKDIFFYS